MDPLIYHPSNITVISIIHKQTNNNEIKSVTQTATKITKHVHFRERICYICYVILVLNIIIVVTRKLNLFLWKSIKLLPLELLLLAQICTKSFVGWAYSAPTDPLAGLRGGKGRERKGRGRGRSCCSSPPAVFRLYTPTARAPGQDSAYCIG